MIEAVIVNHNTSVFTELALRSLRYFQPDHEKLLTVTVLDNESDDEDLKSLVRYCADSDVAFVPSGAPRTGINTHGDVLRTFVLSRQDANIVLLLDADICFLERNPIARMLQELDEMALLPRGLSSPRASRGCGAPADIAI